MTVHDAIFHRRSIRRYADRPLEPELVRELLEAAVQAPSAMNRQPWAFAVFHGRALLAELSQHAKERLVAVLPTAFGLDAQVDHYNSDSYSLFHGADTLVVISAKPTGVPLNATEDCFLAAENLMLAAYERGVGSCLIGFARLWLSLDEAKAELGIPPDHKPVIALALGYPAVDPPPPERRAPEITTWWWR